VADRRQQANVTDRRAQLAERQVAASRPRLQAVASRMPGSHADAGDAVQEAWLRISRTDANQTGNLGRSFTTITRRSAWIGCGRAGLGKKGLPEPIS
jgi:DNA-directed RNA polymerase specialized sigma24 family protein